MADAIDYAALAAKHGGKSSGAAGAPLPPGVLADQPGNMEPRLFKGDFLDLADPMNFLPVERTGEAALALGRAGVGAAREVPAAIATAAHAIPRGALAGALKGGVTEAALEFLPAPFRIALRAAMAAGRGGASRGAEAAGSVASRAAKLAEPTAEQIAAHAMGPIRGGAEAQAFREGGVDAVNALRAEKAAKKASDAGKKLAEHRWGKAPEVIEGGKPQPGSSASRVQAAAEKPRHDVRYFSTSRGEHIDIEGMNQKHLEQAYNKLARTNPKPGSVARRQMDALLNEAKHRYQTTDIHIGQGGK